MSKEITLDVEKLQQIIAATVATTVTELRKPVPPTAKELADLQQAQEERKATGLAVKEKKANRLWLQTHGCTHSHPKREGGGTHCVFVHDNGVVTSPGYVYCQKCEGRFRPDEPQMRKLDPEAIFDTEKFNELLQDCMQGEMFA